MTRWLRAATRELGGLFVDDGWFAGLIAAWLVVCFVAVRAARMPGGLIAILLPLGLGAVLAIGAWRAARR